jgi:hypothetical protein
MSFCLTGGGVYHIRGGKSWLQLPCPATGNPNLGTNFSKYECHFSEPLNIEKRPAAYSLQLLGRRIFESPFTLGNSLPP